MSDVVSDTTLWSDVLDFWFDELKPAQWFVSSAEFDATIKSRFSHALAALASNTDIPPVNDTTLLRCGITGPDEVLAAILLTDQFSRNIFRGSPQAFRTDPLALALSKYLIDTGALQQMDSTQIQFAIMPHMHAESQHAQDICVTLFTDYGIESGLASAIEHRELIQRFGRFPHRNEILGRDSTEAELQYLKHGKRFGQR